VKPSESSRHSNEKWEEEENDYDECEYDGDDDIDYLALQINKSKIDALVSEHYSSMNGNGHIL
jgi:hypothetical protein